MRDDAPDEASVEIFNGKYDSKELSELIDSKKISMIALDLPNAIYSIPRKEIASYIDKRLKNDAL